jgi:outer membrane protein TolC
MIKPFFLIVLSALFISITAFSQNESGLVLSLDDAILHAVENHPVLEQYRNSGDMVNFQIKSIRSGWLPQVGLNADYSRYFQQPVAIFPDFNDPESGRFQEVRTGVPHNASLNFSAEQSLVNNELFRINAQSSSLKKQALQSYEESKIEVIVGVSKAFYEVLLAEEQMNLAKGDLVRQEKQLNDAQLQFEAGVTDNIDYKRAMIAIQNTQGLLYQYQEDYQAKITQLRYWLGLEKEVPVELQVDYESLESQLETDTLSGVSVAERIEYQLLETRQSIQESEIHYQKRRFFPSLTAFYNYNILFLSPTGRSLWDQSYPFSLIGLRLNYPIFLGGQRHHDTKVATLEARNLELEQQNFMLQAANETQEALSAYKSSLYQLRIQNKTKELAEEIYNTISLQYEQGIKNFLEVIVAETDLRTARINYLRALFNVLENKLDLEKARGEIKTDY